MHLPLWLVVTGALLFAPAFAIAGRQDAPAHDHQPVNEAAKAYMDAHMKMMKDMNVKPSGDPDRDFVDMMIPHHQGAIEMAKVLLQYGKDPELKKLAVRIIAEQEKEIAQMRRWRERTTE